MASDQPAPAAARVLYIGCAAPVCWQALFGGQGDRTRLGTDLAGRPGLGPTTKPLCPRSHLPHGFYEDPLRKFFAQFGTVTNLRLSRNKATGASKHHAWLEFQSPEVAAIAAEAMDGYFMFKTRCLLGLAPDAHGCRPGCTEQQQRLSAAPTRAVHCAGWCASWSLPARCTRSCSRAAAASSGRRHGRSWSASACRSRAPPPSWCAGPPLRDEAFVSWSRAWGPGQACCDVMTRASLIGQARWTDTVAWPCLPVFLAPELLGCRSCVLGCSVACAGAGWPACSVRAGQRAWRG